jgi:hypothetical protein
LFGALLNEEALARLEKEERQRILDVAPNFDPSKYL